MIGNKANVEDQFKLTAYYSHSRRAESLENGLLVKKCLQVRRMLLNWMC